MTLLLQILGFAALAGAMRATPPPFRLHDGGPRRAARIGGVFLLCVSMLSALRQGQVGFAILDWFGLATIGATLVSLILAVARRKAWRAR